MTTPTFVEMTGEADGGLQTRLTHGPSGRVLSTDAPQDNGGNGASFSPTDMVASGLLACMLTTMALAAAREGIAWGPSRGRVEKHMNASPRRIGRLEVELWLPAGLTHEQRARMQHVAESCPVHRSLHPEVQISVRYH